MPVEYTYKLKDHSCFQTRRWNYKGTFLNGVFGDKVECWTLGLRIIVQWKIIIEEMCRERVDREWLEDADLYSEVR